MKIIFTHSKTDDPYWTGYPPALECNEREEKIITFFHKLFYGKDWYCVDPLGHTQILYIMWEDLPFSRYWQKKIECEHRYI